LDTHIKKTAYYWLLGNTPTDKLPERCLFLFGNPDLFHGERVFSLFNNVQKIGVFYYGKYNNTPICITTPKFGASITSLYIEVLGMTSVRKIMAIGYTGALLHEMEIGQYFLPTSAIAQDGTTSSYFPEKNEFFPSHHSLEILRQILLDSDCPFYEGTIISIDALLLENPIMIKSFANKGYKAVDLETACLFALSSHLNLSVSALHIISDNQAAQLMDKNHIVKKTFPHLLHCALNALVQM